MQLESINPRNTAISKEMMERLYQEFRQQLFQYVLSRVGHRESAEDIISIVFVNFFQYLLKKDPSESHHYRGLLYKIAKNEIADHFRGSGKDLFVDITEIEIIDDQSMSPFEETDQRLTIEVVDEAIEKLPEYYKELIRLRHIAQLEYSEIAELLSKKEGAIRVALHRALKMAQELVKK